MCGVLFLMVRCFFIFWIWNGCLGEFGLFDCMKILMKLVFFGLLSMIIFIRFFLFGVRVSVWVTGVICSFFFGIRSVVLFLVLLKWIFRGIGCSKVFELRI